MTNRPVEIYLCENIFQDRERLLVQAGQMKASVFRFESGVAGLRLSNEVGELILLPFQGQQIWSAKFYGRELTMTSMFSEPRPTRNFLETYGAFLLHCGASAMGGPSAQDNHPLHGEPQMHPTIKRGSYWGKMSVAATLACLAFIITQSPLE